MRFSQPYSALALSCALLAASTLRAQEAPPASAAEAAETDDEADATQIVVIGQRAIVAALSDVAVERTYTSDEVESYAVSTIGEVIEILRRQNNDRDPAILVNGQPVRDLGDVANLPMEAIARVEQLPRGAAQRMNGGASERVYNLVLRPSVRTVTLSGNRETATEGGWASTRGEVIWTFIKGKDRANFSFKVNDSDPLREAERPDFVPRTELYPFSPTGNLTPAAGLQIDPALSAAFGQPVTIVALAGGDVRPTIQSLLQGANRTNPSVLSNYATLRGESKSYEMTLSGNKTLADWASVSFNGRLGWLRGDFVTGLPSARFLIPSTNPFTPLSQPAYISVSDSDRPLHSVSRNRQASFSTTASLTWGKWHATILGQVTSGQRSFLTQFSGPPVGGNVIAVANPFDGSLPGLLGVTSRITTGKSGSQQVSADMQGPVGRLWAGDVQARFGLSAQWSNITTQDPLNGARTFAQHVYTAKAGITVPLTGGEEGILGLVGNSDIAVDIGRSDAGRFGKLERYAVAFNWSPLPWARISASESSEEHAVSAELAGAPQSVTPDSPFFDPVAGKTVYVTTIYGGGGQLANDRYRMRMLSLNLSPYEKYRAQLSADYFVTDIDNQLGALPPPSSAIVAAFPDRFVRDASGTLVLVDNRSVNFARQRTSQLRLGTAWSIPLAKGRFVPADPAVASSVPRSVPDLILQVNASHTFTLASKTVIREGLPEVDLLDGGAIGLGGAGTVRNASDLSLSLARGGTGAQFNARRRGVSYLAIGSAATPDLLTFGSLVTMDAKVFADLGQLLPESRLLRRTRASLSFTNVLNRRQTVSNNAGQVPQSYQPIYRDPIGRTVSVELRKVF
ncbi:hypothetical protein [Tsuneonella sp. HG222]